MTRLMKRIRSHTRLYEYLHPLQLLLKYATRSSQFNNRNNLGKRSSPISKRSNHWNRMIGGSSRIVSM